MRRLDRFLLGLYCVGAVIDSLSTHLLVGAGKVALRPGVYVFFVELNPFTEALLGSPLFFLREAVMVAVLYALAKAAEWIIRHTEPKRWYVPSSPWPVLVGPVVIRWWAALNNLSLVALLVGSLL